MKKTQSKRSMNKIDVAQYLESFGELSVEEFSKKVDELCPKCRFIFFEYAIENPNTFSNKRIIVLLYQYALMHTDFFDLDTNPE